METSASVIINSVDRALDILLYLHAKGGEASITAISQDLKIYKSTVYRTLVTLENKGFVEQNMETGRYSLGKKLFVLGMGIGDRMGLRKVVRPYTRQLHEEFGEAVNVSILDRSRSDVYQSVIVWREEGGQIIHFNWEIGSRNDCYCAGVGKCLLAFGEDIDLSIYEEHPMKAYTEKTIRTVAQLEEELEKVRRLGYALDDEEREAGLTCVAAPILRNGVAVAAVSISGPTSRMKKLKLSVISGRLKEVCREISQELA